MKKYIHLLTVLLLSLVLSGCGNKTISIDSEKLSQDLLQNVTYKDELVQLSNQSIANIYNIDYAVAQYVYVSTGATAEEIAVFELESKKDANKALESVKQRIEEQKQGFESYVPEEIKKLNEAIVTKVDNYVIVCISSGSEAKDIIQKYVG